MKVTLIWQANMLLIRPWIPALEAVLIVKRRVPDMMDVCTSCGFAERSSNRKACPDCGESVYAKNVGMRVSIEPFFSTSRESTGTEVGVTHAGILERVQAFLKKAGHEVQLINKQPPLPKPAWLPSPEELRPGQAELIAVIGSSYGGGRIKSPTGSGKTFVMEVLCRMYPYMRILVSTRRGALLTELYSRLETANPDRVMCMVKAGKSMNENADIVVCSALSLHRIDPDWPDLIFFDECHNAAAPKISEGLSRFRKARIFGFSASPEGRSDNADILSEAIIGPVLCEVPYEDSVESGNIVPLDVWVFRAEGESVKGMDNYLSEAVGIWRNWRRNKLIADVAHLFSDDTKVLIMVRTAEHAYRLRRDLPEFDLVYDSISEERRQRFVKWDLMTADEPASRDVDLWLQSFKTGKAKKIISTTGWQEGLDIPDLCVLIRAEGQSGSIPSIQIGGRLSRKIELKQNGILVDFDDSSFGLGRRTESRLAVYRKQKWAVHSTSVEAINDELFKQGVRNIHIGV